MIAMADPTGNGDRPDDESPIRDVGEAIARAVGADRLEPGASDAELLRVTGGAAFLQGRLSKIGQAAAAQVVAKRLAANGLLEPRAFLWPFPAVEALGLVARAEAERLPRAVLEASGIPKLTEESADEAVLGAIAVLWLLLDRLLEDQAESVKLRAASLLAERGIVGRTFRFEDLYRLLPGSGPGDSSGREGRR